MRAVALVAALLVAAVMGQTPMALPPSHEAAVGNSDPRLQPLRPTTAGNKFVSTVLGARSMNETYGAGQEVRLLVASAFATNESMRSDIVPTVAGGWPAGTDRALTRLLKMGNYSLLPAFNATGPSPVRVRVIAAYSSRTATMGTPVACGAGSSHDVWAEFWSVAPRNLVFGRHMVYSGFVTFTVPPFHFRTCVKDVSRLNHTRDGLPADTGVNAGWTEFENQMGNVQRFHEAPLLWRAASTTHQTGDFVGIEVVGNLAAGSNLAFRTNGQSFNYSTFTYGDSVKLVPFGYPCTYEKEDNRVEQNVAASTSRTDQYCGANAVGPNGDWMNANCGTEGSVAGGVANVGSRMANPLASSSMTSTSAWSNTWTRREHLVAYLQLPAAGEYDVCVSTRLWRKLSYVMSGQRPNAASDFGMNSMPVWTKAYDSSSSTGCAAVSGVDGVQSIVTDCQPRKTALVVTAASASTTVTWTTTDDTPATWGEIKFTAASGTLNYGAATAWDHSSSADYYTTTGGDQFRLVPEYMFWEMPSKTTGDLATSVTIKTAQSIHSTTTSSVTRASASYTSSGLLSTAGVGKYTQYALGKSDYGSKATVGAGSGCFWQGSDNYGASGHFGNPGTSCCSSAPCTSASWCAMSDSGSQGPTASADLGGNPRTGYSPWALDGTGTNAWGYVRFPSSGTYRVCYKKAGTSTWQALSGSSTSSTNGTLAVKALNAGYTYHFNDSRAETWGPVAIKALAGDTLTKQAWNYYTESSSTAVGAAFKMVLTTESCYVSAAQSRTYSMNPGSLEMVNTLGSADDSMTATSMVYFYVKVPAHSTTIRYRACFRPMAQNWHALSDPNFAAHQYMTVANEFGPRATASLSFTLNDVQTGSWGKFIVNRTGETTPSLNVEMMYGDMVRLVPNVSETGVEVGCDRVWDSASTVTDKRYLAQKYDAAMADVNLGLACAIESSVSTDACFTGNLKPTSNSVVATTPYTDLYAGSDWNAVGLLDGATAFIQLPMGTVSTSNAQPVAYKVCYRQARFQNWIEAVSTTSGANFITVTTARTLTVAAPTGVTLQSGQYSYVAVTAAAEPYSINVGTDLVKLVPFATTCDAPAVANAGYELYTSLSGANSYSCVVDGSNSTTIEGSCGTWVATLSARAYMTMPTVRTAAGSSSSYRVCYMSRSSTTEMTRNWHDLSGTTAFDIVNHGIVYTAMSRPYYQAMLGLRFTSGDQLLDTRSGMDSAKIVSSGVPCADTTSTDQPSAADTASVHRGIEVGFSTAGITNVGPTDLQDVREARIDVVLPTTSSSYKVCYKPYGKGWLEILQAPSTSRVYGLSSDYVMPTTAEVESFIVDAAVTGSYTNQPNYNGVSWSTVAVGGAATMSGATGYLKVAYPSGTLPTAAQSYKLKFVRSYAEPVEGTYTRVGDSNCFSDGVEVTYTTSGTATDNVATNLPITSGKYTVCVMSAATGAWYQAPKYTTVTTVDQPMTIVASKLGFAAAAATNMVTVWDLHSQNGTSFGGLAALDQVYVINATGGAGACGVELDWTNTAVATAQQNLSSTVHGDDTTNFLSVRMAEVTLPAAPRTGSYAVCLKRSQAAATNHSGTPPFVRAGWYHVPNVGAELGPNTDYLVVTGATKLNISACPIFNSTFRLRSGRTFDMTVRAEDATNTLVPFAVGTKRYEVTAVGAGYALQSSNGECAASNAATYGYTSGALGQYMSEGKVKYSLTALSACPAGGCMLSFTSPTLTASPVCSFDVQPTFVFGVRITSAATTCVMGSPCSFRVVALHADGGIAHTVTSGATFAVAGWTSSNADGMSGTSTTSNLNGWSTGFVNGVIDLQATFKPSGYSATASETVTLTVSANGKTSNTVSFTVHRPVLSGVHVVDVYPVGSASATPLLPLQPSWEPSTGLMTGGDDIWTGSSTVTAGSGYHLVSGQAYALTLRAVATTNSVSHYATSQNIVPSGFAVDFDSTFKTTLAAMGNELLWGEGSMGNTRSFSAVSWAQSLTMKTVTFRLKNSGGCGNGCTMPLTFANTALTASVTTPVRSIASKLQVVGCATTLEGLAMSSATTCTGVSSTVNRGWYINVSAVDEFGNVDTFFDGDIVGVLSAASARMAAMQGVSLTTVAALTAGTAAAGHVKVTAVNGFATVMVTVSKPCAAGHCDLQLMSTWGANVAMAGSLVATANTVRLMATLDTVLAYCSSTSTTECDAVEGVSLANTTNAYSLIYKDTRVCMNVQAVDASGMATLYETNWIGYFARDVTGGTTEALTLTDESSNTGFVQRYKPLKNSMARFCFTVSGFTSVRQVQVHFVAQRFGSAGTYWSHGTTGAAMVGTMRVWPKKLVSSVLLSSVSGGDVVSAGKVATVSAAYTGSAFTLGLGFLLKDHYNATILPSEASTADLSKYLTMRMDNTLALPQVTVAGDVKVRGDANVTLLSTSALNVTSSQMMANVQVNAACLGCSVIFELVDQTDVVTGLLTLGSSTTPEYLGTNVTLYVVNQDATAVRKLAFNPGTSPLTSYWINGTATSATTNAAPTYHVSSCFSYASGCVPTPASLNLATCDARGTTTFGSSSTAGLKMRVYVMPSGLALSTAMEPVNGSAQVDIMNTYAVSMSIGNQVLVCKTTYGAACTNDVSTAPVQTLLAYGATVRQAIGNFIGASDATIRTTNFFVEGRETSAYLAVNASTSGYDSQPNVGGAFSATATGSLAVSGLALTPADAGFYFRPTEQATKMVLLSTAVNNDACNETATYPRSAVSGVMAMTSETGLAFAYAAQTLPMGVAVPMTVEVQDSSDMRVTGASGTVTVTTASWVGCNNGGEATFTGAVANGRATVWVTFTKPCEKCVLQFALTPSGGQGGLYAAMNANPASQMVMSAAITVTGAAQAASEVAVMSATPATVLTSSSTPLTVASAVTVTVTPRATVGMIPFATMASTAVVALAPRVSTTGSNWWWVGNGGVLRPSTTGTELYKHHQVVNRAVQTTATLTAAFSRTCASCRIYVSYKIGSGSVVSNMLPSTFVVTTAASQLTLVGFAPRSVKAGQDIAVALWSTGSEDASVPVAGVAPSTTAGVAASASFAATNNTNGDGGRLMSESWVFTNTQVHRLSFTAPCDTCTVTLGGNSFPVRVFTTATHLRPGADAELSATEMAMGVMRPATMVTLESFRAFPLMALDDQGFVDQSAGMWGCDFPALPFQCVYTAVNPTPELTSDGMMGSFPVSSNSEFIMSNQGGVRVWWSRMVEGRAAYNMSFTTPQREVIPVFTAMINSASVSSAQTTGRMFPVPKYSVSVGTSNLAVSVVSSTSDLTKLTAYVANTFHVALVGTLSTDAASKYVAVEADNTVTVAASAGCPAHTLNASGSSLMAGYASYVVLFTAPTATGVTCDLTFTVGAGSGSCAAAADCTATMSATVSQLRASSFEIVRPSMYDNLGAAAGPMYAHAGRTMKLRVALQGRDALNNLQPVTTCTTCALSVTSSDCGFTSATATPVAGSSMAEVSLAFADNSVAMYTCSLTVTATGPDAAGTGTVALTGPGSSTTLSYTVSVCKSASVKLVTNTSMAYRGMVLRTGVAYDFYAVMMTSTGVQCFGDSQDDATALTLSVVDGATGASVANLAGVNVNATSTTTEAFMNGNMAAMARMGATAVGGAFNFRVVFTNSTMNLGLMAGVKVQIAAASLSSTVTSGAVHTAIAASRLKWGPLMHVSPYAVKSRAISTGPMGATGVSVMAVDGLMESWMAMGLMSGMPNVAAGATEYGNDASVMWRVSPTPSAASAFPLTFTGGSAATTLAMGRAMWSSVSWTGTDGIYGLSVASSTAGIAATPEATVRTQTVTSLMMDTRNFTMNPPSAPTCSESCVLPNGTFTTRQNATINGGNAFLSIDSLTSFSLTVLVTDGMMPVRADNQSVIALTLNSNAGTSVVVGMPPAYQRRGTQYARVVEGRATFELGLIGDTLMAGGVEEFASLSFSCPAMRPAELLLPGESAANPCTLTTSVTTETFQVVDTRAHTSVLNSATVIAAKQVIKAASGLSSYRSANVTLLKEMLAGALNRRGVGFLHSGNIDRALAVVSCTVNSQFPAFGDLGSTVCGANMACAAPNNLGSCPIGVDACGCPATSARSLLLSRFLLQNTTTANTTTAMEFAFDLGRVDTLPGQTAAEVAAQYVRVQDATVDALTNDEALRNGFQITAVGVRSSSAVVTTVAPQTQAPQATQPPAQPPAPTPPSTEAPSSGASAVSLSLALLAAAVLALFA